MNVNAIFCVSIAPCTAAVQDLFDQENKKMLFGNGTLQAAEWNVSAIYTANHAWEP